MQASGSTPRRVPTLKAIYVAGGSDERLTVVRPIIDTLTHHGIHVVYDWTRSPGYDRLLSLNEIGEQAQLDLEAVRVAEIVWVVSPDSKSEGASVELGAALVMRKTVFISGPYALRESRIFHLLATRIFMTHDAALREVLRLAPQA
jgi:hypothetical protein